MKITKLTNGIKIENNDNILTIPFNSSVLLIENETNMAVIRSLEFDETLAYDVIGNITIDGQATTKEDIQAAYDAVANNVSSGGGGSVAWDDITNKPSTFAPSPHTHVTADVTDLQGKLDAKADKTSVPTVQTTSEGNQNNYIYSIGKFSDQQHNVIASINPANDVEGSISYTLWGSNAIYDCKIQNVTQSRNGLMLKEDKTKLDSINVETLATKDELSALQSALQSALERIAALEAQVGNISTQLDNINGEIV